MGFFYVCRDVVVQVVVSRETDCNLNTPRFLSPNRGDLSAHHRLTDCHRLQQSQKILCSDGVLFACPRTTSFRQHCCRLLKGEPCESNRWNSSGSISEIDGPWDDEPWVVRRVFGETAESSSGPKDHEEFFRDAAERRRSKWCLGSERTSCSPDPTRYTTNLRELKLIWAKKQKFPWYVAPVQVVQGCKEQVETNKRCEDENWAPLKMVTRLRRPGDAAGCFSVLLL